MRESSSLVHLNKTTPLTSSAGRVQLLQRHPSSEKGQQARPRASFGSPALLFPYGPLGRLVGGARGEHRPYGKDPLVHRLLGCNVSRFGRVTARNLKQGEYIDG